MATENKFFYNERPYIYIGIGFIGILFSGKSKIGIFSCLVLVACGAYILYLRHTNKERMDNLKHLHSKLSGQQKDKNSNVSKHIIK
jgi:hypothetical protein